MSRRRRSVVVGQFGDGNGDTQLFAEGVPVGQKIRPLIHCLRDIPSFVSGSTVWRDLRLARAPQKGGVSLLNGRGAARRAAN